jgi:uridine monophosphate synthetase
VLEGLKMIGLPRGSAALLLVEMSSKGNLAKGEYSLTALKMAEEHRDFVMGFITQHPLLEDPGFINFTPGVQLNASSDHLGQRYITPHQAIIDAKSDVIIVGRGIYSSKNPEQAAIEYRQAAWTAYQERCQS